jgi:hypothetical protein
MKANPDGQIDSADLIGRDGVIRERLAQQIIVQTAERRICKTSIIKLMVKGGVADAQSWLSRHESRANLSSLLWINPALINLDLTNC